MSRIIINITAFNVVLLMKLLDFHAELSVRMIDEDRSEFMRHQYFALAAD